MIYAGFLFVYVGVILLVFGISFKLDEYYIVPKGVKVLTIDENHTVSAAILNDFHMGDNPDNKVNVLVVSALEGGTAK